MPWMCQLTGCNRPEAESRLNKVRKAVPSVPTPQTAQGLYSDEARSAQWRDNLADQRLLQDQRDITGNDFGNSNVIYQGNFHYY